MSGVELNEDEVDALRAIAVTSEPTVGAARDTYIGPLVPAEPGQYADAVLSFRKALLSLHEKGLVSLPDGCRPALPADTVIGLTGAGWAWIDANS